MSRETTAEVVRQRDHSEKIRLTFALSVVVGSLGTFIAGAGALFIASGVVFGLAFSALSFFAVFRPLPASK